MKIYDQDEEEKRIKALYESAKYDCESLQSTLEKIKELPADQQEGIDDLIDELRILTYLISDLENISFENEKE